MNALNRKNNRGMVVCCYLILFLLTFDVAHYCLHYFTAVDDNSTIQLIKKQKTHSHNCDKSCTICLNQWLIQGILVSKCDLKELFTTYKFLTITVENFTSQVKSFWDFSRAPPFKLSIYNIANNV